VLPSDGSLTLVLQPGVPARFRVLRADGTPAGGASVSLTSIAGVPQMGAQVQADDQGLAELRVPPGPVEIAAATRSERARTRFDIPAQPNSPFVVRLAASH
jgi:hypothetical protein